MGPPGSRNGNPPKSPYTRTHTHAHKHMQAKTRSPLRRRRTLKMVSFLLRSCSTTLYKCLLPPSVSGTSLPQTTSPCSWPSVSIAAASWSSPFPLLLGPYPPQTSFALTITFCSQWRNQSQLRASSTELGREALRRTRIASTGKKSRKSLWTQRSVITIKLWRYGISRLINQHQARYPFSDALVPSRHRYKTEHPEATPQSIEASKDFIRCIAFGIEGKYNNPWACLSSVAQAYKDFTGGWQWTGNQKIDKKVTVFTFNVRHLLISPP